MLVFCIFSSLQTYYQPNNLTVKYNRKNYMDFRICIKCTLPPLFFALVSQVCVEPDDHVIQHDSYMFLRAFYASVGPVTFVQGSSHGHKLD